MFTNANLYHLRAIALALATAGCLWWGPARLAAQTGLGLRPMRIELSLAEGVVHSDALTISNESPRPIRVRADLLDFNLDDNGTPQFERVLPSEARYTCRQWLSLNPRELEVAPGGSVDVRYTLRVPLDAAPGSFNCAAGFTTLPPAGEAVGMGIRTAVRMIAAFYVLVGQPGIEAEVAGLTLEPLPGGGKWRSVLLVRNWSTRYLRPSGELVLLDPQGRPLEVREIPSLPVLPNRLQRILLPLEAAPEPGGVLRARVDLGLPEIYEVVYKIPPPEHTP